MLCSDFILSAYRVCRPRQRRKRALALPGFRIALRRSTKTPPHTHDHNHTHNELPTMGCVPSLRRGEAATNVSSPQSRDRPSDRSTADLDDDTDEFCAPASIVSHPTGAPTPVNPILVPCAAKSAGDPCSIPSHESDTISDTSDQGDDRAESETGEAVREPDPHWLKVHIQAVVARAYRRHGISADPDQFTESQQPRPQRGSARKRCLAWVEHVATVGTPVVSDPAKSPLSGEGILALRSELSLTLSTNNTELPRTLITGR
jgi:hypothetical protein